MPIMLDATGKVVDILAKLAAVIGVPIVLVQTCTIARQTKIATDQYQSSVRGSVADRSSEWMARMREPRLWDKFQRTLQYLGRPLSEKRKLSRIDHDLQLQHDVSEALAFMEDLGYVYNTGLVDSQFVTRGPAGAILQYYKASQFWVERERGRYGRGLYAEFESMARSLCTNPAVAASTNRACAVFAVRAPK